MTPAVDRGLAINPGREETKPNTLAPAGDGSVVKRPLFKRLLNQGEQASVQSRGTDSDEVPVNPDSTELSIPYESSEDNFDATVDLHDSVSVEHTDAMSVQTADATENFISTGLSNSVALERGGNTPATPGNEKTVPAVVQPAVVTEEIVKSQVALVSEIASNNPSNVERSSPPLSLSDARKNNHPVSNDTLQGSALHVSLQKSAKNTAENLSLTETVNLTPASTVAAGVKVPEIQGTTTSQKELAQPFTRIELTDLPKNVKQKTAVDSVPVKQAVLDNTPVAEYRSANPSPQPLPQPLIAEFVSQPIGSGVVSDTNPSARVDASLTAQQSLLRPLSSLVHATAGHINMMVSRGIGHAAVQLNPADLGAMQISIDLKSDQLSVQISVAQSATREVMEAALPRLRDQLQAEGFTEISIDLDSDHPGEQQADQQANANADVEQVMSSGSSDPEYSQGGSAVSVKRNLIDLFA